MITIIAAIVGLTNMFHLSNRYSVTVSIVCGIMVLLFILCCVLGARKYKSLRAYLVNSFKEHWVLSVIELCAVTSLLAGQFIYRGYFELDTQYRLSIGNIGIIDEYEDFVEFAEYNHLFVPRPFKQLTFKCYELISINEEYGNDKVGLNEWADSNRESFNAELQSITDDMASLCIKATMVLIVIIIKKTVVDFGMISRSTKSEIRKKVKSFKDSYKIS